MISFPVSQVLSSSSMEQVHPSLLSNLVFATPILTSHVSKVPLVLGLGNTHPTMYTCLTCRRGSIFAGGCSCSASSRGTRRRVANNFRGLRSVDSDNSSHFKGRLAKPVRPPSHSLGLGFTVLTLFRRALGDLQIAAEYACFLYQAAYFAI